ncbi:peptide-methionine (S)-S-oxide reductase MsrA [Sulfurirhabdus autotrophica]|uniref:Peptide methionine sulfoxide reductase MsrA n=1 Tax=Sulfurirhabdus autotrophica TaxID=1706046 RepID=A0A4R3Y6I5_9PROT|nr:peptide-methionine (S)-S-oxide reductase MsrA [Sulfurirhabdus autotrophica]TCV87420.1 peptide-methionine (S)-S-oxide reductase [Sulfurirhabdus autotrophica]
MTESNTNNTTANSEIATLGGGCFWCLEAVFDKLNGVTSVESGYTGGQTTNPTYADICTGTTGHAEVVRINFNPSVISFREILDVFFTIHDPTTLNRQGNDRGTQYRSVIYYHSTEQKETAEKVVAELNQANEWGSPLVTEVMPEVTYYPAEDYHQEYFEHHPNQPYCMAVVAPKVAKANEKFAKKLKR